MAIDLGDLNCCTGDINIFLKITVHHKMTVSVTTVGATSDNVYSKFNIAHVKGVSYHTCCI